MRLAGRQREATSKGLFNSRFKSGGVAAECPALKSQNTPKLTKLELVLTRERKTTSTQPSRIACSSSGRSRLPYTAARARRSREEAWRSRCARCLLLSPAPAAPRTLRLCASFPGMPSLPRRRSCACLAAEPQLPGSAEEKWVTRGANDTAGWPRPATVPPRKVVLTGSKLPAPFLPSPRPSVSLQPSVRVSIR